MSQSMSHNQGGHRVSFASSLSTSNSNFSTSRSSNHKSSSSGSSYNTNNTDNRSRTDSKSSMDRPQSFSDFSTLMDASMPLFDDKRQTPSPERRSPDRVSGHSPKKPSISLAQGLIMNNELQNSALAPKSPYRQPPSRSSSSETETQAEVGEESLFYAYAVKSDYPNASPYLLTFATPAVCAKWWSRVHREYPETTRPSTQLFVVKSEEMQQIQDNPKLADIRNQWFCTSQDRSNCATPIIPLQAASGQRIGSSSSSTNQTSTNTTVDKLAEKLEKLTSIVQSSAEQIHALSVAQSAGLQRMQQINESNSTQINAIAESQTKLQALVDQNASHYIALTNTSFQSQEKMREVLQTTGSQIQSLNKTQSQLAETCKGMIRTMETHSASITHLDSIASDLQSTHSTQSTQPCPMCSSTSNRINPPPRKLNRRIKGVWYEYDNTLGGALPESPESPRRTIMNTTDSPPKAPSTPRKLNVAK